MSSHSRLERSNSRTMSTAAATRLGLVDGAQFQFQSLKPSTPKKFPAKTPRISNNNSNNTNNNTNNNNNNTNTHVTSLEVDPNSPFPQPPNSFSSNNNNNNSINNNNHANFALHRHLTFWDLLSLGVGGTVGSGIFVLTGQIAHAYAGPATFVSWSLAGLAATTSALSLCELASRIPATGSTYVYCQVCGLGRTAAVAAAACLTLEYVVSGAAVSRTWGDKVVWWISQNMNRGSNDDNDDENQDNQWQSYLIPYGFVNLPATAISAASTILLLMGVKESKQWANFFTSLKMLLVLGMIVGGFCLWNPSNFVGAPFTPYGVNGVLRGATSSFFGYLGYDEVCVVAGEALHPSRDIPRAILGTLGIVTVCYISASLALVGMEWYEDISPESGFPAAFASNGWHVVSQVAAAGELVTLPVVVLISLLAQPRLTLSLAQDGILPPIFARHNADGNLIGGTLVWGTFMTVTATLVPFTYLDDLISCGILVAFCLANSCLIVLRYQDGQPPQEGSSSMYPTAMHRHGSIGLQRLLLAFNTLCCCGALLWSRISESTSNSNLNYMAAALVTIGALFCFVRISSHLSASCCGNMPIKPKATTRAFYDTVATDSDDEQDEYTVNQPNNSQPKYFRMPCVPVIPCLGMAINWYLIAQLEWHGLALLLLYLGGTVFLYRICRRKRTTPTTPTTYESVRSHSPVREGTPLT